MKRILSIVILAVTLIACSACQKTEQAEAPNTQIPSVMHDGILYRTTGKQLPGEVDESAILGCIQSVVHGSLLPEEDGQANFPAEGAPYAMTSDGLVVLVGTEWTLFLPANSETE